MPSQTLLARIGSNIAWLLSGTFVKGGVALVVAALTARYLGPSGYGSLAFASMFVGMFSALTQFGLQRVLVRLLVRYPENRGDILGSAIVLRLTGTILTCVIVWVSLPLLPVSDEVRSLALIFLIGLPLASVNTLGASFDSKLESRYRVWAQMLGIWIRASIRVIMIYLTLSILIFPWADVAGTLVTSLFILLIYFSKGGPRLHISRSWMRRISRQSMPLIAVGLLYAVQMRIDQIMLASMIDERALGIYTASLRLYELWLVLPGILATSILPRIVDSHQRNADKFGRDIETLYCLLAWMGWPIAIVVGFGAPLWVSLIFGDGFTESVIPLQIMICGIPIMFLHVGRTQWAITVKQQGWQAAMALIALLLKIVLNLWLIPTFGVAGAALAMPLSLLGFAIISPIFFNASQRQQVIGMLRALFGLSWNAQARIVIRQLRQRRNNKTTNQNT